MAEQDDGAPNVVTLKAFGPGPFTLPLDQVLGAIQELDRAHQVLDALDLPPGLLTDRLVAFARKWLAKVGPASSTHPAMEARKILRAAGARADGV